VGEAGGVVFMSSALDGPVGQMGMCLLGKGAGVAHCCCAECDRPTS